MDRKRHIVLKAFADKEVGIARHLIKHVDPARIAGEGEHLAVDVESKRVRWRAGRMVHLEGRNGDATNLDRRLLLVLDEDQVKVPRHRCGIRIERLRRRDEPGLDAFGARNHQGPRAVAYIFGVDQEPRKATEMVPMQMGDEHRVDIVRIDPEPVHADQRRGPTVDEERRGA